VAFDSPCAGWPCGLAPTRFTLPAFSSGGPLLVGGGVNLQTLWILHGGSYHGLMYVFFELTYTGKALRACVINRTAALLVGINPSSMSLLAFAGSGAIGAAAGIFITPITLATYDMGFMLGVKGFVAAAIGGMHNIRGAVLGGFIWASWKYTDARPGVVRL
jgi:branched-chain amino acid transport system permease protein